MSPTTSFIAAHGERLEAVHYVRDGAPCILFCHGFPGVYKHYDVAECLHGQGFDVVVLKYRGVDGSSGYFTFSQAVQDVSAAVAHLAPRAAPFGGLGVFGYSAGAYYAIATAATQPGVRSIAALSPVVDLPRTARLEFENLYELMLEAPKTIRVRGVHDLVASFAELWHDHPVLARVRSLENTPLLILEGDDDKHGDPVQAHLLFEAAREPKELCILPGAGHYFEQNDQRAQIGENLARFFARTLGMNGVRSAAVTASDLGGAR